MLDLRARVHAEFREMPGLTLTLPQAARLFSLNLADCKDVLEELVQAGHLTTDGRTFAGAGGGPGWAGPARHGGAPAGAGQSANG